MNKLRGVMCLLVFVLPGQMAVHASNLDTIGVTLLRTATTNVNGAGIRVAQPESGYGTATNWEVNPDASGVGQPASLFTYYSSIGTANNFPNAVGAESGHADGVAGNFYGMSGGVATNVTHVDNYEANYFINHIIALGGSISARIVNQSFTGGFYNPSLDQYYDNYAAKFGTLFLAGAGYGNTNVWSPATCYNGIGVGESDNPQPTYGPTPDGRSKPDITAPGMTSSDATPYVAGAAAVLMQAGLRGDGGSDTISAADLRTVKALLLNGAVKPAGWTNVIWTNGARLVLDTNYGAGMLNVFNSYQQLAGQKQTNFVSASVSKDAPHPPTGATNTIGVLSGWDITNLTSSSSLDAVAHYYFNATHGVSNATFTATATLVWNRQQNQSSINNLYLFLYSAANSNLVAACTSAVDNVQHLYVPALPPGRYDLQVLKKGGSYVSASETYALAFEFFSTPLNAARSGANVVLQWPVYPAGFVLQAATNLTVPVWNTNNPAPAVTNGQNRVTLVATNGNQFFRLRRP